MQPQCQPILGCLLPRKGLCTQWACTSLVLAPFALQSNGGAPATARAGAGGSAGSGGGTGRGSSGGTRISIGDGPI